MTTENFNPAEASGEQNYKGTPGLTLNEVSINGDGDVEETTPGKFVRKGGYFRKRVLVGRPKDEKPEEVNLGEAPRLVFLKIRRTLVERGDKGKVVRSTNEHNSKYDAVTLFADGKAVETGVAGDLRQKYPNLRTIQIVYALLLGANEPELVRFLVRGSSLGSEAKADTTTDFYRYLGSFGGDEHVYEYVTVVRPVLEKSLKSYFAIDFKRGERLEPALYDVAMENLKSVHEKCVEQDRARAQRIARSATAAPTDDDTEEPSEAGYPTGDVNPDDIPFR